NDYLLYYGILTGTIIVSMILNLLVIIPLLNFASVKISIWRHLKKIKWIYACYIAASLYAVIDSIILGWMSTETAVGYYSFGYRLIRISAMLIPTLGVVFIPRIAFHFAASNKKEMMNQIADSSQLILFLGVPVSFFFFVLAPEIIEVFAGSKFEPTITICRILSPLPLFIALSHLTGSQVLLSTKKEKIYFIILGIGLLINLLMNVILIPQLVERAPAISNLTVEGFVMLTTILYLRRQKVFHFPFKYLVICILCSLPLFPVTYYFRQTSLDSLSILIFAFLITITLYSIIHLKFLPDSFIRRLFSLKASK
ncbi:MAG: oligosaccharide flippase family protein, partial [Nitrososphaeraceae archaeon]